MTKEKLLPEVEQEEYAQEHPQDAKILIALSLGVAAIVGVASGLWEIFQDRLDEARRWTIREKQIVWFCTLIKLASIGVIADAVQKHRQDEGMAQEECRLIVDETGAVVDQVCEIVD